MNSEPRDEALQRLTLENGPDDGGNADAIEEAPVVIPRRQKRRRLRKRKFIAGLLAALIPGTGHLYLGLLRKGISVIFIILLDIAAMLYFSSIGMQINVPLLILLAFLIPVVYFYNLYDVLQSADRLLLASRTHTPAPADHSKSKPKRSFISEPGIAFGLLLLIGGVMMFLFRLKPPWLQTFIENDAGLAASVVLIAAGLLLAVREISKGWITYRSGGSSVRRAGRYTAAVILAGVGALLLLDSLYETERMLQLLKWWPLIPVLWGAEYVLIGFFARRRVKGQSKRRSRMDLRGLLSSIVIAASVFLVAEQEHYLHLWNKVSLNLTAATVDYGEAEGSSFEKAPLIVPVELNTSKITVDAINGDILIHRAAVEDVEITATVWVDQLEGVLSEAVAEQSFVEVTEGATIKIIPHGKAYGESGKRQPRMDLDISLPEDRRFNLDVRTMNGDLTLQNVEAIADISLETGNGELILHRIFGNVKGKTLNGAVRARAVNGNVELATSGGSMDAWDVEGSLKLTTAVGNISATGSGAEVNLSSKNGNLLVNGARSGLQAESLNGTIDIRSSEFGGDWDIYSAVGDIELHLPADGHYEMKGSSGYGNIYSDIPALTIDKKTISGTVGTGEFQLQVEGNSNLDVKIY
ncbi:DUF4097 family beta strand repeat-containing protein [Paenibacillus tengchongensis]|uniref:DUF4097 family beta strand repeat-containing protein n=1 Tax=Paenibacillus tengchongensis TaxID=2608684 RepID=UPI001FE54BB7|nr:DUF4097 family beta strand repeat-containing protein [Paenibacillus tengchongensis]